ncbi:tetratricopeptide repeat protein [Candidatus Poribacteria bacterium]|nr:tetratricopeptide repeat protein [Candidatus Poribacteria bacterium]MYF54936.1 tetratricopeptide repeat protein [Candidatus Poribacteria bacterium]
MNNSKNKKLVPRIAEQLIIELFAGQTKELNEIKTKVEEIHKQRGGLPHTARIHPVKRALDNLKRDGRFEKPDVYWKIHATKEQTTTENRIKTLPEFIEWTHQFNEDEGEYVFRGVPNKAYKIQASAYRRPKEDDRNFEQFLYINKGLIRAARQRGYDRKDGREWSDLDILVELQHYGAATCLIDFSYSAQIALWFACRQEQKKEKNGGLINSDNLLPGKVSVIQLKRSKFTEITPDFMKGDVEKTIDYFLKESKNSRLYYLKPMFQNNRIISQQSVLLFGNYELEADEECFIEGGFKDEILTELERTSGYTEDRLFPDFEGFAWVNREAATYTEPTYSALIDFGERAIKTAVKKEYEEALEYFSRAIRKDPNRIQAYNFRGRTYTSLERYDRALEDFENAENIDPDNAETYFNRGCLYQQQGQYSGAINEYDTAIRKNKEYGEAYYRRGQINYDLDQVEDALTDFTEAIRLKTDYFDAYFQRGLVLKELHEYSSAYDDFTRTIELTPDEIKLFYNRAQVLYYLERFNEARLDLLTALDLAKQQDNKQMVADIEVLFQDVFGPNTSKDEDE